MGRVTWGVVNTGMQQQVMINMLKKIRQSSIVRSLLTADDLDNSVKMNRQTTNADLMWIQESSSPAVLIYCQRNGSSACPFGQTMHIISCNQELSEWNSRAFGVIFLVIQYHELELWTLELNSALAPGSAIYSLCSRKSYLIFLSQYFHLYMRIIIVFVSEGRDKGLEIEIMYWKSVAHSAGHTARVLW